LGRVTESVLNLFNNFPPETINLHNERLQGALSNPKTDWKKLQESVDLLKEFVIKVNEVGRDMTLFMRSYQRTGSPANPQHLAKLQRYQQWRDSINDLLLAVEKHKKE